MNEKNPSVSKLNQTISLQKGNDSTINMSNSQSSTESGSDEYNRKMNPKMIKVPAKQMAPNLKAINSQLEENKQ